jgi:hypothetical protein
MRGRLARLNAQLNAYERDGLAAEIGDHFTYDDVSWLLREVEKWKHVAENDLYGMCWCDAPRHDCCTCPGVQDDD